MTINIRDVLSTADDKAKRAVLIAEEDVQKYIEEIENEYLKIKTSAELEVTNLRASLQAAVRDGETKIGAAIEAKFHEIAKGLGQDYQSAADFVKRIFAGLPAHVQPGRVQPYEATPVPQVVKDARLHPEDADGNVILDQTKAGVQTADRSQGVPDITK